MSDTDQFKGTPFDKSANNQTTPEALKTLTVLTFVGCGIFALLVLISSLTAKKGLDAMEKMQGSEQLEKMPDFFKKLNSPEAIALARVRYENIVPLNIIALVSLGLCVFGAIQMRALQKQGFFLWVIGNLLPIIGEFIFIGTGAYTGFFFYLTVVIFLLFLILYSTQLKYLK